MFVHSEIKNIPEAQVPSY